MHLDAFRARTQWLRAAVVWQLASAIGVLSASCWLTADLSPDAFEQDGGADHDGGDGGLPCPGEAGPPMVRIDGYCIDSTEVTNADYAAFLMVGATVEPRPECSGTVLAPPPCGASWPFAPGAEQFPVECVDWCDADLYCRSVGKRLCGSIEGGPNPPILADNPETDQWHRACSHAGAHDFPYGDEYDAAACVGVELDAGKAVVGSLPCEGGYPGIFDMLGNLWEWTDVCNFATGPSDYCRLRGGSYEQSLVGGCGLSSDGRRDSRDHHIGFRCCTL
jgi:sulfatase modifying factor 1